MSLQRWKCPMNGCDVWFRGERREQWGQWHLENEHELPEP